MRTYQEKKCEWCGAAFAPTGPRNVFCAEHSGIAGRKVRRPKPAPKVKAPPAAPKRERAKPEPSPAREQIKARLEADVKEQVFSLLMERLADVESRVELLEWEKGEGKKTLAGKGKAALVIEED